MHDLEHLAYRHEIPTHLGTGDPIIGRLTGRHLCCLAAGGIIAYGTVDSWPALPLLLRATASALSLLLGVIFAFVRPHGRALEEWLVVLLHYYALPRRAVWRPRAPQLDDWRRQPTAWGTAVPRLTYAVPGDGAAVGLEGAEQTREERR